MMSISLLTIYNNILLITFSMVSILIILIHIFHSFNVLNENKSPTH